MKRPIRAVSVTAAAVAAALVLSACGSDDKDTEASAAGKTTAAAATSAAASPAAGAGAGAGKLAVVKDAKLGQLVTDGAGFVLYRFDKDTDSPSASNCSDDCAQTWPPVIATGKPAVEGIDASLVGTVKRADGTEQVTIKGWPIYRFAADTTAGQTNGQAVGGVWWAVTAAGGKAGASGSETAPVSKAATRDGY